MSLNICSRRIKQKKFSGRIRIEISYGLIDVNSKKAEFLI